MTLNEVTIKQEACGPKVYKNEIKIVIKKIKLNFSSVFQQLHNVNAKPAPGEKKKPTKKQPKTNLTPPPKKTLKTNQKKPQKTQKNKGASSFVNMTQVLPG